MSTSESLALDQQVQIAELTLSSKLPKNFRASNVTWRSFPFVLKVPSDVPFSAIPRIEISFENYFFIDSKY